VSRPAAILAVACLAAGCCTPPTSGPVPLRQLLAEYNANAAAVPRLWARAKVEVTVVNDVGRSFTWGSVSPAAAPNGLLVLGKGDNPLGPYDFVLVGRETLAAELFRLGSSTSEGVEYFWYRFGEEGRAYWARHAYVGAPCAAAMPLQASQVVSLLGVTELPADLTRLPAVVVRLQQEPCDYAYVLTYIDHRPVSGQIAARREIYFRWDDRLPRRPYLVKFFDYDGREILTAELADYRPIQVADVDHPPAELPVMPTDLRITWTPEARRSQVRSIRLKLSEMTTADRWDRSACAFRENLPAGMAGEAIVQTDRPCDTPKESP